MKKRSSTVSFYDRLAKDYHLIFVDWNRTIKYQSKFLSGLISSYLKIKHPKILDCSCGIGTQAIALALRGYDVTATDISPAEIRRAKDEANKRHLKIKFGVADFRQLATDVPGLFDVVISFDNALPHLLTDDDMKKAIKNIGEKLNPRGLFLASIRDYDVAIKEKPKTTTPNERRGGGVRRVIFQIWDWQRNSIYKLHHFILKEKDARWTTEHRETKYRAWQRRELTKILKDIKTSRT